MRRQEAVIHKARREATGAPCSLRATPHCGARIIASSEWCEYFLETLRSLSPALLAGYINWALKACGLGKP